MIRLAKRTTINDVARTAGVSRQTVSRALNDKGEIDGTTKQRVIEAARQLGYQPSRFARGMVGQTTTTIGLVIPDLLNPFFTEVASGALDAARARGWHVIVYDTADSITEERAHAEGHRITGGRRGRVLQPHRGRARPAHRRHPRGADRARAPHAAVQLDPRRGRGGRARGDRPPRRVRSPPDRHARPRGPHRAQHPPHVVRRRVGRARAARRRGRGRGAVGGRRRSRLWSNCSASIPI